MQDWAGSQPLTAGASPHCREPPGPALCNTSLPEATGIMEDVGAVCQGEQRVL